MADKTGQTALEYLLLLVIIIAAVVVLMMFLSGSTQSATNRTSDVLEGNLQSAGGSYGGGSYGGIDTDNDGLEDSYEISIGTDPNDPDSDDDIVIDGRDLCPNTQGTIENNGCPAPTNPTSCAGKTCSLRTTGSSCSDYSECQGLNTDCVLSKCVIVEQPQNCVQVSCTHSGINECNIGVCAGLPAICGSSGKCEIASDEDNDNVADENDHCSGTSARIVVDVNGCSAAQRCVRESCVSGAAPTRCTSSDCIGSNAVCDHASLFCRIVANCADIDYSGGNLQFLGNDVNSSDCYYSGSFSGASLLSPNSLKITGITWDETPYTYGSGHVILVIADNSQLAGYYAVYDFSINQITLNSFVTLPTAPTETHGSLKFYPHRTSI